MYLAGLHIREEDVRAFAKLVDEPTRSLLQKSLGLTGIVALTIDDRERMLIALHDAGTDALLELRGVLLFEQEWQSGSWSRR